MPSGGGGGGGGGYGSSQQAMADAIGGIGESVAAAASVHAEASKHRTDSKERQAADKLGVTKQLMQDRKVTLCVYARWALLAYALLCYAIHSAWCTCCGRRTSVISANTNSGWSKLATRLRPSSSEQSWASGSSPPQQSQPQQSQPHRSRPRGRASKS